MKRNWILLPLLSVMCAALFAGCGNQTPEQLVAAAANQPIRTDTAPIARRLPKLGQLQSACWKAVKITSDSFLSPPEHPAYRIQGYAQLEKNRAEEISQQFKWHKVAAGWKPALAVTNLNLASAEWSQSEAFTKECKPQQIPGELSFEFKRGIVYFDLEIEK